MKNNLSGVFTATSLNNNRLPRRARWRSEPSAPPRCFRAAVALLRHSLHLRVWRGGSYGESRFSVFRTYRAPSFSPRVIETRVCALMARARGQNTIFRREMGFRGPRLGSCSGIGLSVRLEKQGPARRARRLTNRAGSVAARTEVGSHPAVADRHPNHTQDAPNTQDVYKKGGFNCL